MNNSSNTYQVAIVGGGAVGLFLAICLKKLGISCVILEKRTDLRGGSRSLSIHPVALELFDDFGISRDFLQEGIRIKKGKVFLNTEKLGSLSLNSCPKPHNFILTLPQYRTEAILEQELRKLDSKAILRGAEVDKISQSNRRVTVSFQIQGERREITANYLVGCDGMHSFSRKQAEISFEGKLYNDTYIMGDFSDNTSFGTDGVFFLCDQGLVETFPLPDNIRRWVVKTEEYKSNITREDIEKRVLERIGHDLRGTTGRMMSSFRVQKRLARPMVKHRLILAGDAAHVVSPMGGQGMNLGWLGAADLAHTLHGILREQTKPTTALSLFEQRRIKAARNAMRRAELNMYLGRKPGLKIVRNSILSLILNFPVSRLMARVYTMRGVERWIT